MNVADGALPLPVIKAITLPVLQLASDGETKSIKATIVQVADHFGLTDEQRQKLLSSGNQEDFSVRQGFVGALATFTSQAKDFIKDVGSYRIALVDGHQIAELMLEHGLGVETYNWPGHRLNEHYFGDDVF